MLSSVLGDENTPLHVRNAAGLALKNALTARVRVPFALFFLVDARLAHFNRDRRRQPDKPTSATSGFL